MVICFRLRDSIQSKRRRAVALFAAFLLLASGVMGGAALQRRPRATPRTPIDDLSVPAKGILALSPDVAAIEVLVGASRPTHRIVQIADAHYLSREEYRLLRSTASEEGYADYSMQVEQLQKSQSSLLRWLVDYHGLREVFEEAVSEKTLPEYIADNLKWHRKWQESRAEVRALASRLRREIDEADARGKDVTDLRTRERDAEKYLGWRHSAVRDLLISRPCVKLLPAEDEQTYQRALQVIGQSVELRTSRYGPVRDEREAAIVRNLLSHSKCAVIVLGGGHDLSNHVQRLGGGRCEYVRVVPKGFPERIEREGRTTWVSQ